MPKGDISVRTVDELKIDKDCFVDKEWIDDWIQIVVIPVLKRFDLTVVSIRKTNSRKKGIHFYIKINKAIQPKLANKLQYLLGDDAKRVAFNDARIRSGLKEWNKLFEEPYRRLRTLYRRFKKRSTKSRK